MRHIAAAPTLGPDIAGFSTPRNGYPLVVDLLRSRREALLAAALAAASAELLRLLIPVGIDTAAQLYQTARWLHGGFQFWDNYWYDGRYSFIDYSLLYYPLAGIFGSVLTVMATLAGSGYLFARLMAGRFGVQTAWPIRAFAVTTAIGVWISGEYPFALGMALGLLALALRNHRRLPLAGLAALGSLLASPLAFLLLMLSFAGIAIGSWNLRRLLRLDLFIGLGLCCVVAVALQIAFPVGGSFHFSFWALFQVLVLSALAIGCSLRLRGVGVIRSIFATMTVAALGAYLIPSPIGGNATRLIDYIGAPLIWILLARQLQDRRLRRSAVIVLGSIALAGQLAPNLVSAAFALNVRSAEPGFWRGAIRFLHAHDNPNFRVEAVDSAGHWDAYYLPSAGIPIVRGWFRQDDFPDNALLYRPRFSAFGYRSWLRHSGVRYVVLPRGELDYSAIAEGRLLEAGHSGLRVAYRDAFVTIYELPKATPLLVAPAGRRATVVQLGHSHISLRVSGPGRYALAINFTPYWRVQPRGIACVQQAPNGMSSLLTARAGVIRLYFSPTLPQLLEDEPKPCHLQA